MAYIRIKKIHGKPYAYLVESFKTKKGSRQKVKQYLGRVYKFENKEIGSSVISTKKKEDFLLTMVLPQLETFGFKQKKDTYVQKSLVFSTKEFTLKKKTKSKTVKDAIIKCNEGYLCSFTLQRLLDFKKSEDFNSDAYLLAKYFLEAGLVISKENFVGYYGSLKK